MHTGTHPKPDDGNLSLYSDKDDQLNNAVFWGTNFNFRETEQQIKEFIRSYRPLRVNPYDPKSPYIVDTGPEMQLETDEGEECRGIYWAMLKTQLEIECFDLNLDASHIFEFDRNLYFKLIYFPAETILYIDRIINEFYQRLMAHDMSRNLQEHTFQARIKNLQSRVSMRELKPKDINHLLTVQGVVTKASSIFPEMKDALFQCTSCGNKEQSVIDRGRVEDPGMCGRCGLKNVFQLIHNLCVFTDKQYVRLQELPENIPDGTTPSEVTLILYDDMVDMVRPGDKIEVVGIFRAQPVRASRNKRIYRSIFRSYLDVVSLVAVAKKDGNRIIDKDELEKNNFTENQKRHFRNLSKNKNIYNILVNSFAPSIFENEDVKKGLLCQLFAGTLKKAAGGNKTFNIRNEINILLLGDPSTAKSQLLQYVYKLAPRSMYTSGKGSSAVGLTAYIIRDPETRELTLEPGALILSDKGICCIDEFDKMNDNARQMLHEVMEQQTVSITKSGIVCTLNSRTAVLAAANPRESKFNTNRSIIYNISFPYTLLSRFDLIFIILDKSNESVDSMLAQHILKLYSPEVGSNLTSNLKAAQDLRSKEYKYGDLLYKTDGFPEDDSTDLSSAEIERIPVNLFAKYIAYSRYHCFPAITELAENSMIAKYIEMRKLGSSRNTITASPRQLESLIRLSEALAKMRLSDTVEKYDVDEASRLIKVALHQSATDPRTGTIDMSIITTGNTSSINQKIDRLVELFKDYIGEVREMFRDGSVSIDRFTEEINKRVKLEMGELSSQEISMTLTRLEEEKLVTIIGSRYSNRYRIKYTAPYSTV